MDRPADHLGIRLAAALRRELDGEVRFDPGSRHLYSTDASHYRQIPIGVVTPKHARDVERTVALCREHGAPITSRGGGTSLAGQATNAAVIVDFSRHMDRILEIDPERRTARVEPGVVLDDLRAAANEHGLTFGPDPSTHNRCTLGGMIGNDSCGIHSVMAGRTVDNVRRLEVLLYDGTRLVAGPLTEEQLDEVCARDDRTGALHRALRALGRDHAREIERRFPDLPRRVSGYNLPDLLPGRFDLARAMVGTEGTCGILLEAEVALVPWPPARTLVVLGFPDVATAGDAVPSVLAHGPIGLEGIDEHLAESIGAAGLRAAGLPPLPEGRGWLLVEFGAATEQRSDSAARGLMDALSRRPHPPTMVLYRGAEQAHVWAIRESGLGAAALVPDGRDRWTGWEDAAVPPDRLGGYLREYRALLDDHGLDTTIYGHFGDGCVHSRITFDHTTAEGVERYRRFTRDAAELVVRHGGSLSGEHGDGQARADLLGVMFGEEIVDAFRAFKQILDPDGGLNPGKVVDPYPRTSNLRLGAGYAPWEPATHFAYPAAGGSFARETLRCVGIGRCRRDDDHGTMCPSYMVTHEEQHSTRGRARLLFEMLQPDSELDGWRDEAVAEALDLCLSCKGCKTDCPADVDMATYKAEFMAHHWEGRRRPVTHRVLGRIDRWLRLGSRVPRLANAALATPGLGHVLRRAVGVTSRRPAPRLATETFRAWYGRRGSRAGPAAGTVMLFPDTFVDHLQPTVGQATVEVLEAAGYRVLLPPQVCCGRPLYDFGMLDLARGYLREVIDALADHVQAGGVVVGMEPSCIAVFRDELTNLLPDDDGARRLARSTFTLAEFLVGRADWTPPRLARAALVHKHCHQDADIGYAADAELYDRMGLDWRFTDAGCCGLAGSFGFETGKYEVSRAAGERKLIPMVRDVDDATIVMADGFSCRTQIADLQDRRRALHVAEVLAIGLAGDPDGPVSRPEPTRGAR